MRDDSIERTRALEQLAQMKRRMDKKTLSGFLEKRRIHLMDTPPPYSGLGKKIKRKIED